MAGKIRPSKIIKHDDYSEIIVTKRDGSIKEKLIIDLESVDKVSKYRWCTTDKGYAIGYVNGKPIYLHRFLLNLHGKEIVDHINQNPLDNRLKNLRLADLALNRINSKFNSNNTSGTRGVIYLKKKKSWVAKIFLNGKRVHLIETKIKEVAIQKRKEAEEKYYKSIIHNGEL